MNSVCTICPRNCKVDRNEVLGYCKAKNIEISKVMKHHWEEPIISGTSGSGTIFFTHCSLRCVFCQNYEISQTLSKGEKLSPKDLAEIFKQLENDGVHNINLVSPTHFTDEIIEALNIYKPNIPIVWNTSGYETSENIQKLKDYVDIYLVDIKYFNKELSLKYSNAKDYFEFASNAILEMRKNQPKDIIKNGIMQKGMIIRHLVLPSHFNDSISILEWIKNNLGNEVYISLMSQYTPCFRANEFPEINRKLKPIEYKIVLNHLTKLNFTNGFTQGLESSTTKFIPEFKKTP